MTESPKDTQPFLHVTINGTPITAKSNATILEACQEAGLEIPVFCYHEKLSVAGNCRMCLVEVQGSHKLVASCHSPLRDGMIIETQSPRVAESRAGTLELLLANHPLDCPVCDQAGMCDLQDLSMAYGFSKSHFSEKKRLVSPKHMGPLIDTEMTRCIHCTLCVRFATEVAGVEELGVLGRGESMEIATYLQKTMTSNLSGNIIDLCPVGALNAKPSKYKRRPWELRTIQSIDVTDSLGASLGFQIQEEEIVRVIPMNNPDINEMWLTDKARFSYDGLRYQRLDRPYKRIQGRLSPVSWEEALSTVISQFQAYAPKEIAALSGDLVDVESLFALRSLLDVLGVDSRDSRKKEIFLPFEHRQQYLLNTPLQEMERADVILLVGVDPQREAPLLNVRLRRAVKNGAIVGFIGPETTLGYPFEWLSQKATVLNKIASADHPFWDIWKKARFPLVLLGTEALRKPDGESIYKTAQFLLKEANGLRSDWNGFNILHGTASQVGALEIGFTPMRRGFDIDQMLLHAQKGDIKFLYLLGRDDLCRQDVGNAFVVYQGHHGDRGAEMADVVFPGCAYTEKQSLYVNGEGRVQETAIVASTVGEAKEDWRIIRELSRRLQCPLAYETRQDLLDKLMSENTLFKTRGKTPIEENEKAIFASCSKPMEIRRGLLSDPMLCYYQTDVISRSSPTMAACAQEIGMHKKIVKGRS